ncbi:MAG: hypothetical protein DMF56_13005 [Acidobacteria bacterium]|nr:MAG: hypothetical protein DMF56_13005 [Acidobacteriota bacterium]
MARAVLYPVPGDTGIMKRQTTRTLLIAMFVAVIVPAALAENPQVTDLTDTFRGANAVVKHLQVYQIAGIVIIRGTADKAQAEILSDFAKSHGYARVANLIQTLQNNDAELTRKAEVALSIHRALDGCRFQVRTDQGVVHVGGQVQHELQKDVAMQVVRGISGVERVELALVKF